MKNKEADKLTFNHKTSSMYIYQERYLRKYPMQRECHSKLCYYLLSRQIIAGQ